MGGVARPFSVVTMIYNTIIRIRAGAVLMVGSMLAVVAGSQPQQRSFLRKLGGKKGSRLAISLFSELFSTPG